MSSDAVQLFAIVNGKLEARGEALAILGAELPPPVRVVPVYGSSGDGKSTLCNVLFAGLTGLPYAQRFTTSDSLLSGTTNGVWGAGGALASSSLSGSVLVLDFEGSDMGDEEGEVRLAFFAAATATVLFFNAKGPRLRQSTRDGLILVNLARRVLFGPRGAGEAASSAVDDCSDSAIHLVMRDTSPASIDTEIRALERIELAPSMRMQATSGMMIAPPQPPTGGVATTGARLPLCSVCKGCLHALPVPQKTRSQADVGRNTRFVECVREVLVPVVLAARVEEAASIGQGALGTGLRAALMEAAGVVNRLPIRDSSAATPRLGNSTSPGSDSCTGFDWRLFSKSPEELAAEMDRLQRDLDGAEDEALHHAKPAEMQLQSEMIEEVAALPDFGMDADSSCDEGERS